MGLNLNDMFNGWAGPNRLLYATVANRPMITLAIENLSISTEWLGLVSLARLLATVYDGMGNNTIDETKSRKSYESGPEREKDISHSIQVTKGEDPNRSSFGGEERDDEVSPHDFAFAIDLVFELVLSFLEPSTLFKCRLVSHRWRKVSTKVMKKCMIGIYFRRPMDPTTPGEASLRRRTVPELNSFLKGTYTLLAGPFHLSTFPCNSIFLSGFLGLDDPDLHTLISLYGKHLQHFFYFPRSFKSDTVFIQQVENLLVAQAPNLKSLALYYNNELTNGTGITQCTWRASSASSLERMETKTTTIKATKLKILSVEGVSRKCIDSIVAISPNLSQIQVQSEDFPLLIQPPNLLRYVKQFSFVPSEFNQADFEFFEALVLLSPQERQLQNLPAMKCKSISLDFNEMVYYNDSYEDVRLRFVRVMSKILESSWDTLELVEIYGHSEKTLKGLEWPCVLPKLTTLYSEIEHSCGLEIFPLDGTFKIQDTFPGLTVFSFTVDYENIRDSSEADFLRKRNLGPLNSRTAVCVGVKKERGSTYPELMGDKECLLRYYSESLLNDLCPDVKLRLMCFSFNW